MHHFWHPAKRSEEVRGQIAEVKPGSLLQSDLSPLTCFFHELPITDDLDFLLVQKLPQLRRNQQTPLLVARVDQAGAGGAQFRVAVSRMADELPGSLGKTRQGLTE